MKNKEIELKGKVKKLRDKYINLINTGNIGFIQSSNENFDSENSKPEVRESSKEEKPSTSKSSSQALKQIERPNSCLKLVGKFLENFNSLWSGLGMKNTFSKYILV